MEDIHVSVLLHYIIHKTDIIVRASVIFKVMHYINSIQFINQTMYKSFDKLVCTGTTTITYIHRHNTRYVKIYKDEFTVMIYM